jgi:hypothetical protein
MSRKLNSVSVLFALTLIAIAATAAMAQIDRVRPNSDSIIVKGPTLGCCKCLGGTNTIDLSTISSNNWTVNGSPAVFLTQIHSAWNINPGSAQWISTSAGGGTGNVNSGNYDYKLNFTVAKCTIPQTVTLSGSYGGDDVIAVYLDNTTNLISQCAGNSGWCFNTSNAPPPIVGYPVGPGNHTILVKVSNSGGPSGMFFNAKLTSTCAN